MAGRCGCASDQCSCTIVAGENVTVSGTGARGNPYVVSAATTVVDEGGNPAPTAERITGEVIMWGGLTAPTGWLLCNGQAVNRAVYADLFTILGTRFGAGDGSTTFNLPDFTGRFPMGPDGDDTLGEKAGTNEVTLATGNLPAHTHSIDHNHAAFTTGSDGAHTHGIPRGEAAGGAANRTVQSNTAVAADGTTTGTGNHTHSVDVPAYTGASGSTGSGTPVNIKPALTAINFCIKT